LLARRSAASLRAGGSLAVLARTDHLQRHRRGHRLL